MLGGLFLKTTAVLVTLFATGEIQLSKQADKPEDPVASRDEAAEAKAKLKIVLDSWILEKMRRMCSETIKKLMLPSLLWWAYPKS